MSGPLTILFAGGGTGGHLYPGVTLAEAFLDAEPRTGIVFFVTHRDIDRRVLEPRGWKVLYDGGATFVHVKGGAAGTWRAPRQNVAFHRGMGRFYRKFHGAERPLGAWVVYAGIGAKLAVSLTRSAVGRRQLAWRASAR